MDLPAFLLFYLTFLVQTALILYYVQELPPLGLSVPPAPDFSPLQLFWPGGALSPVQLFFPVVSQPADIRLAPASRPARPRLERIFLSSFRSIVHLLSALDIDCNLFETMG